MWYYSRVICKKCQREKGGQFYESRTSACKDCVRAASKRNRLDRIDIVLKRDRERHNNDDHRRAVRDYAKTRRGKRARAAANRAWRRRNRDKLAAHNAVARALLNGTLIRKPCEICGSEKSQAHHDDYAEKLVVLWLCDEHHKERHKRAGGGDDDGGTNEHEVG